jgi:endonuclease/exonuclease/phosphatase family metal-dependent hydrolase
VLVLSWNLYHGRSVPPSGRNLYREFAEKLAGWQWDVALLQEVPPWWPHALGADCRAEAHLALTSRNLFLPLRRFIAERRPDVIKSNGGGSNAILLRGLYGTDPRVAVLRTVPERRVVHGVRTSEGWIANLHAQVHSEKRAQSDTAAAAAHVLGWAGDAPVILGGDFNTRAPRGPGLTDLGGYRVDRVLGRGWVAAGPARTLDHGRLSDHPPVVVDLNREGSKA